MAYAARLAGIAVTVVVPAQAEQIKRDAILSLGADLVEAGDDMSHAEAAARELSHKTGATYIEDGNHLPLMAGAATVVLEMLEAEPRLDAVLVPVGGGNLIAGSLIAAWLVRPELSIVGVQSQQAPGSLMSWLAGTVVERGCETFAGGLATERAGEAALEVMTRALHQIALVSDSELWRAIALAYEVCGFPIEGAGVAGIAALERYGSEIDGERIGVILTGGRIAIEDLRKAFSLRT